MLDVKTIYKLFRPSINQFIIQAVMAQIKTFFLDFNQSLLGISFKMFSSTIARFRFIKTDKRQKLFLIFYL